MDGVTAGPGTLMYLSEEAKGDSALDGMDAANHINKWTTILGEADSAFERALHKERTRRLNRRPIVFAFLEPASNKVQLIHGIEEIGENENHDANGQVGLFLGDRITVTIDGVTHQHDPQFCTVATFADLTGQFHGKPATTMACSKATGQLLPGDQKTKEIRVAKLLPVPVVWWSYFLSKPRTAVETYQWMVATTQNWKSDTEKRAANTARQWCRVACTRSLTSVETSGLAITVGPSPRDTLTVEWTSHSINRYLPRPKPSHAVLLQAVLLARDVINKSFERSDREKTLEKQLPEATLCRLLGLSGLAWADRSRLAPIWLDLHQQQDKGSREFVMRAFFQQLGKELPAFRHFRNSRLFDSIIAHKFEPGATYETCHHGVSLLAVTMRSYAEQEREQQEDDYFEEATNKTPEAVRKHRSKAPPPLPTSMVEFEQLLRRMVVLTTGLFTPQCSLAIQLKDLLTAVQESEQLLMGDQTAVDELIPQLAWAVTAAARKFYSIISTRKDVDPPDEGGVPTVRVAQLSFLTSMFQAGIKLDLRNVPRQWKRQPPSLTTSQERNDSQSSSSTNDTSAGGGTDGHDRRHGFNVFQGADSSKPAVGKNPEPPAAFTNSDIIKLRNTMTNVKLSDIVKEAGLRGGPSNLDTSGLPTNCCLNWVCMGGCTRLGCVMNHPEHIDDAAALAMYQQLAPGIARLLETGKKPRHHY